MNNSELQTLLDDYRIVNSNLQRAKMRHNKPEVRTLTRSKNRISKRIDVLKSRQQPKSETVYQYS